MTQTPATLVPLGNQSDGLQYAYTDERHCRTDAQRDALLAFTNDPANRVDFWCIDSLRPDFPGQKFEEVFAHTYYTTDGRLRVIMIEPDGTITQGLATATIDQMLEAETIPPTAGPTIVLPHAWQQQQVADTVKSGVKPHYHKDEQGKLIKCYHQTKSLLTSYSFWIGVTISYPLEHALWEKLWPFSIVGEWIFGH